ncbi:hypothetical protein M9458_010656 [Cirrhinus mrigala]|uniref:Gypsy retrotransposon integrase-like protein 1 n=1 Tax=Cirrhinus mrigala TaxID=683832 RepID=A0ABD0R1I1_CIRMR
MDPPPTSPSMAALQKTSPPTDPATASSTDAPPAESTTVLHLTTELSAQASRLLAHEQQLDRLTDLTDQLVRALQGFQAAAPPASSPPSAQPVTSGPRLAFPEKFDGTATKCKGFLLQCSLFVNQQPHLYPTDECKISFVTSLLSGRALEWATAVWRLDRPTFPSFAYFLQEFKKVFQPCTESGDAGEQIMALRQGRRTAADYALSFRTLAAQSGWNDGPLKLHYRKGLHPDLQMELACRDEDLTLDQYIELSIRVDNLMRSRKPVRPFQPVFRSTLTGEPAPEPMQLGATKLTQEERERRLRGNLCLYCGLAGHIRANCPTRPPRPSPSVSPLKTPTNCCHLPIKLTFNDTSVDTTALIDSGAAGNFIDAGFVKSNNLPLLSCSPHVAVAALDGRPLGSGRIQFTTDDIHLQIEPSHRETIRFFVITSPQTPVILGYPWLNQHGPSVSWTARTITHWSPYCQEHCLTTAYRYPLPLVPSALEQLRSAQIFTKLDLRSAYNLIRIRAGDEWKTAFSTTSGHYEYRVMPFGLANSPSCFQSFVNEVFRDMLNRWVIVYIDDILVYSRSLPEHINHVRLVLQRLIKHQLYAKEEKCEFHRDTISFLGYIISAEGVAMDEKKVRAVLKWPRPSTLRELQRFLGFANFYRRFIRHFSSVAAPLTAMVRKGVSRLAWSQPALQAFDDLRQRFTTAPILHHPDPDRPFIVEVDASSTGVGAVLSQRHGEPAKMFPCAYFSHKLSPAERNYDVGNRELLAIKLALEEWRHWLEGAKHPFTVLTDHRNLEYLRSAKVLNHRQARWSLFFTRFQFQVSYRPGTQNTKADALSRIHEPGQPVTSSESVLPTTLILAPVMWDLMTEITEAQLLDPTPAECPPNRTYVPLSLRPRVLSQVHTTPSSGHPGIEASLHLLRNRFWWPTLRQDTIKFVQSCAVCNITKTPRRLPAGLLQPLPVPQRPWSHLAVDFVTDLPPSNGYTTILSVVDRFSKGCRFIPLPKLPTAMETAEHLCNWVFRLYGLPEDILSDRGPQFTSRLWTSFFSLLGVNVSLTSGYHPQANGQVERLNQELTRFLRSYCIDHQADWSRYLFWAEYAQNSLRKPATNLTPFQCILGFQPPLFPWSGEPSDLPAVNSWFQHSEEVWDRAHVHLQGAIRRYQEQANRRRRPNPAYEPGQWVWLSTRDLRLRLPCKKLSPRYVGPFKIIRQITPVSYRLELPAEYRISPTFHVSLFKPADEPSGVENLEGTASQGPAPIVVDGEEVYRVNTILDSRRRRGQLQYLVDWEGFGPEERSWTPLLPLTFTPNTQIDQPPEVGADPGVGGRALLPRRIIPGLLTTFPIIPYLGPRLPVPGRPGHFRSVGHFRPPRRRLPREVLASAY